MYGFYISCVFSSDMWSIVRSLVSYLGSGLWLRYIVSIIFGWIQYSSFSQTEQSFIKCIFTLKNVTVRKLSVQYIDYVLFQSVQRIWSVCQYLKYNFIYIKSMETIAVIKKRNFSLIKLVSPNSDYKLGPLLLGADIVYCNSKIIQYTLRIIHTYNFPWYKKFWLSFCKHGNKNQCKNHKEHVSFNIL